MIDPDILQNIPGDPSERHDLLLLKSPVFRLFNQFCSDLRVFQKFLHVDYALQLVQKPAIDFGFRKYLLQRHELPAEDLRDTENPFIIAGTELFKQLLVTEPCHIWNPQSCTLQFQRGNRLGQRRLEIPINRHDLSGGLHLRPQFPRGSAEFIEGPFGNLDHAVIQRRLKACTGTFCNIVFQLIQRISDGDFRGNLSDRITGSFRGQRRGTTDSGIDLDDDVFISVGIQGKLGVASPLDFQTADNLQGRITEHLILCVVECLCRRHDDAVAGVNPCRIQVFHAADNDTVILAVAHHLIFDFLPACDGLLYQNLAYGAFRDAHITVLPQFLFIMGDAPSGASQGIGRSDDNRIPCFLCESPALFIACSDDAGRYRLIDLTHQFLECFPILSFMNAFFIDSQKLDSILFENSLFIQRHRKIETGLSSESSQYAVRSLLLYNFCYRILRNRFQIHFVRNSLICHDRGWIAVDQDSFNPFLGNRLARLRPGIIELRRLTDDNRPGADDHHLLQ